MIHFTRPEKPVHEIEAGLLPPEYILTQAKLCNAGIIGINYSESPESVADRLRAALVSLPEFEKENLRVYETWNDGRANLHLKTYQLAQQWRYQEEKFAQVKKGVDVLALPPFRSNRVESNEDMAVAVWLDVTRLRMGSVEDYLTVAAASERLAATCDQSANMIGKYYAETDLWLSDIPAAILATRHIDMIKMKQKYYDDYAQGGARKFDRMVNRRVEEMKCVKGMMREHDVTTLSRLRKKIGA